MNNDIGTIYNDGGRVYLRRLTADDVNQDYLDWFEDAAVTEFLDPAA